jgi:hypothetical protein
MSELLLALFRTGGYRYSLEPGTYGVHSTDELLFDRKLGFCEHYAASYVIALRMLGVPARVVTGYQGAEPTSQKNLLVVRNRHAHAWAEYWDNQAGWIRADPTAAVAPARLQSLESFNQAPEQIAARSGSLWASPLLSPVVMGLWKARQQWDAGSYAWEQWLQNFNQEQQMAWLKSWGFEQPSWRDLVQLLNLALLLLLAATVAIYVLGFQRKPDPWLKLLETARDKVMQLGVKLPPNASPKTIALALPTQLHNYKALVDWLMALEQLRYQASSALAPQRSVLAKLSTLKRQFKQLL